MLRIWRAVGVQPAIYLPPTLIFTATTLRWCRRLSGKMHFYALRGPALFLPVLLFLCPFQQRIHERTRPLRPCLAVASSIYLQSTVNRCPTNRPTGCSLLRSRWRRMIDHLPANAFPFEIRGDTRCCLYVSVDLPYRMPRRNLRTYRAVINVRLNGSMITR